MPSLTFVRLLGRFGNAIDALAAPPDITCRIGKGRRIELPSVSAIKDEIAATQRLGARLLANCEPAFPKLLVSLDSPPLLTVRGSLALARPDAVAIVGARDASAAERLRQASRPARSPSSAAASTILHPPQHARLNREIPTGA